MLSRPLARWMIALLAAFIAFVLRPKLALADDQPYDVAISGGGPAGLAAALSAKFEGGAKRIVVLEKREGVSGRPQTLVVEGSTVAQLKRLGIDPSKDRRFVPLQSIAFRGSGDTEGMTTHPVSLQSIEPAEAGAKPDMLKWRMPVALIAIDDAVEVFREAVAKVPGIELKEGVEVKDLEHVGSEVRITAAERPKDAETHDAEHASKALSIRARYHFNAPGVSGPTYGGGRQAEGPKYSMGTAVFHDAHPERAGHLVFTMVKHEGKSYRVIIGGRPGQTTMNFDVPEGVDRNDHVAVNSIARSFARQSGFYGKDKIHDATFEPALVKPISVYDAQRTNAETVISGPAGHENNMNGGDNLVTATPWPGLGMNHAVHIGALFGRFYQRAEAAKTPAQRNAVTAWLKARAATQIAGHHIQDRLTHVVFPAPQNRGVAGKLNVVKDIGQSTRELGKAARTWASVAKANVARLGSRPAESSPTHAAATQPVARNTPSTAQRSQLAAGNARGTMSSYAYARH